jgi:L-fuconolactonase
MIIDAHQHFWTYRTQQTSWMEAPPYATDPAFAPIRRSFQPADLIPHLKQAGVDATVLVEATDCETENDSLLAEARGNPWIAGVVGWIPLHEPERARRILERLATERKFVGVRHLMNVERDPDWIIRDDVLEGLRVVAEHGLTFDFLGILPRHLQHVPFLADRVSGLRIVIDHLGKPPVAFRNFEPWGSLLTRAAALPNVFGKLSGLDAGGPHQWSAADLARYVEHALQVFTPGRLMFGSDWPVSILRGGYAKVWHEMQVLLSRLPADERRLVLGDTAMQVYRLDPGVLVSTSVAVP